MDSHLSAPIVPASVTIPPALSPGLLDLEILAGQLRPLSMAVYRRDIAAYLGWCGEHERPPAVPESLEAWRQPLVAATRHSPNTINRQLSPVRRLARAARKQLGGETAAGFAAVEGVSLRALKERLQAHARTRISPAQMRALCDAPDSATLIGARDRALLAVLASSGVRIQEAVSLTPGQIEGGPGTWVLSIIGKTDVTERRVDVSDEAIALVQAWLERRPVASTHIFTAFAGNGAGRALATPLSPVSAWKIVQRHAATVDLDHIKCHDLRRFCLTQLIVRHGLENAQFQAGHSSPATTARYNMQRLAPGLTNGSY